MGSTGRVLSQGEVVAELLVAAGYDVALTSRRPTWFRRGLDTAIAGATRRADVAVVDCYSGRGFAMAELAVMLLRGRGIPVIAVLHGGNLPHFAAAHPRRVASLLGGVERVVAPSQYLATALGHIRGDIQVIANTLPLATYPTSTRSPARPRLLWMRTFEPAYRPQLAVDVLARVRAQRPDATLTMGGQDNGLLAATRVHARALGIESSIRFPGFLGPQAKYDAFREHDLFLSTNAVDNAPVSVVEAAASGLVVVGPDAGGLRDVLPADALLLSPDGNPDNLARLVLETLDEPAVAERVSARAQTAARSSSREHVTAAWERLLAEVVEG